MLDDRRKPLPEVYKPGLRIRGKIVPRRRFGDKGHALGARLDLLQHLGQRDDVNVVIAAVEKPFQVSHMQVDASWKVGDHADRDNLCAHEFADAGQRSNTWLCRIYRWFAQGKIARLKSHPPRLGFSALA